MNKGIDYLLCLLCIMLWTVPAAAQKSYKPGILITEVLFDPIPVIDLPPFEFIQLTNNTDTSINLSGYRIKVGKRFASILTGIAKPKSNIMLISPKEDSPANWQIAEVDKWISLPNGGSTIMLINPSNELEHLVEYHPQMFDSALEQDGGYSLYFGKEEWGLEHEWNALPLVGQVGYHGNNEFLLYLTEQLPPAMVRERLRVSYSASREEEIEWDFFEYWPDQIVLELENELIDQEIIITWVGIDLVHQLKLAKPQTAEPGNVVISEIMFDPMEEQQEFIELYNNGGNVIEVGNLIVTRLDAEGKVVDFSKPLDQSCLLFPGEYLCLCDFPLGMIDQFGHALKANLFKHKTLPNLLNDGCSLQLLNEQHCVVDELAYDKDWHFSLLDESKGRSLERVDLTADGRFQSAWFSSGDPLGASPGRANVQCLQGEFDELGIALLRSSLSPNLDGSNDLALVKYLFDDPETLGYAEVRDLGGVLVKVLRDWDLFGQQGSLHWDGTDHLGRLAKPGLYVLVFNYRLPGERVRRWKRAVMLY